MNSVRAFLRKPLAVAALVFLVVVVLACLFADVLAPYDPIAQDLAAANSLPTPAHLLGADTLGRDILSRLLFGGQVTLSGSLVAVLVFLVFGLTLGMLAGYVRGVLDVVLTKIVEVLYAVPVIIILLVVLSVFSQNLVVAMVTLGVLGFGGLFRVVRATTLAASGELYVKAARASGLSHGKVLWRHILPNVWGPVIVQVSLFAASAVLVESGLAFLGFSVKAPDPSWGSMISDASQALTRYPWLLVPPGATIALVVLCLGLVGDGVRDSMSRDGRAPARNTGARAALPDRDVPETNDSALLSVRDLSVGFGRGSDTTIVVRNVNFDVMRGEALGIVGESGSGKTVTARALIGLLGSGGRVLGGSITFDGVSLGTLGRSALARLRGSGIGLIPQEPMNTLDPVFTIGSQLREVIRRHDRSSRRASEERAVELLELVGIHDPAAVLRKYPHELSGGMAQRIGIALALAGRPKLLIADEPTTALDVTVQQQILDLLVELRHRFGMALVLVTHDWGVLADVCDRAAVMYAGEVVEEAAVVELYERPLHPYTRALIAANPHGAVPGEPLPSIPGQVPPPTAWPKGCHFASRCALATDACREAPIPFVLPEPDRGSRCIRIDALVGEA
ncbi:dipeptide/oligopeptide/nickel ABC transporter permease/ATP-binding protein [Agreia sp. VKM Ac-1783]|uniref:dipeptide/oligopeptide/nickel ABC transporter permease/ATP-binding protein n=1 Tax=Agreia sp. VKM Ac-1783 TaxID=1938889 RepID=UPI000A2AEBDF|nr:dipeptide/oligopeptide/nickel ABC transporter permease/ATP-binding protein [Agreia sp. VKM Ac-1783]SMQ57653.1 peptide/nickel transport system permease protein [Agreia sp. VKM Ac-1783]